MDVRQYFRKLREIEAAISEEFPLVISVATADGGKAGVLSEVSRFNAAKMIAEGRAVLADEAAKAEYRAQQQASKEAYENARMARQLQVAILDPTALAKMQDKQSPNGSGK